MSGTQPNDLVHLADGASISTTTERTLRRWIAAGHINAYRQGRKVFVSREEILAHMAGTPLGMTRAAAAAERRAQTICELIETAPPLSDSQRERISRLVRTGRQAASR